MNYERLDRIAFRTLCVITFVSAAISMVFGFYLLAITELAGIMFLGAGIAFSHLFVLVLDSPPVA